MHACAQALVHACAHAYVNVRECAHVDVCECACVRAYTPLLTPENGSMSQCELEVFVKKRKTRENSRTGVGPASPQAVRKRTRQQQCIGQASHVFQV